MQQLLKLLDDNNVSRYRVCEHEESIRDIFWTHFDPIKLFNLFPIVLIVDLKYKTNKYMFPLLEIVGATSTKKTYSVGFEFFESEKEDNGNWDLEVSWTMLKGKENTLKFIIFNCDTALMNSAAKVFHTSFGLFFKYHIIKIMRSRPKIMVRTK